jgi:phosphate transport system substrate-binding protein
VNASWKYVNVLLLSLTWAVSILSARGLVFKGSDTLGAELIPRLGELFSSSEPEVRLEIAAEGSSTGILAVIEGGADFAMSSRPLTEKERLMAEEKERTLVQSVIALDAIVVIVHESNPVDELSLRQVEAIFCGDLGNWASFGGNPGYIYIYTRHTASGTYVRFRELALRNRDYSIRAQKLAGNEQIVAEVAANAKGIGYVSLQKRLGEGVKALAINGSGIDIANLRSGQYPLLRNLYLVYDTNNENPMIPVFLDFIRSRAAASVISSTQFIPAQ